jgi:hypothetical protein
VLIFNQTVIQVFHRVRKNQFSQSLSKTHFKRGHFFLALLPLLFRNEVKIGEITQFSQPQPNKQTSMFMQAATIWQTLAIDGYCWITLRFSKPGFTSS